MAAYIHQGITNDNGLVDLTQTTGDDAILRVNDADDGLQICNHETGNFEWWYFDIVDLSKSILLKIVFHMGTDPLRRSFFPQLALSVKTEKDYYVFTRFYSLDDVQASKDKCDIRVRNELTISTETIENGKTRSLKYNISIDFEGFTGNFTFTSLIEGWKPIGNKVLFNNCNKSGAFYWVIPVPKAIVNGVFRVNNIDNMVVNAVGYHDHNAWIVNGKNKLFMDDVISRWCWGKAYTDDYCCIFMDTHFRSHALRSTMISYNNVITHSSNNLSSITYLEYNYDTILKATIPFKINIALHDKDTQSEIVLSATSIVERKDLLGSLHAIPKWIIRSLIARPFYAGMLAEASILYNNENYQGFGNYEIMHFKRKAK